MFTNNPNELDKQARAAREEWDKLSEEYSEQMYAPGDPIFYKHTGGWVVPGYIVHMTIGHRHSTLTYCFDIQLTDGNKRLEKNIPWYRIYPDFEMEKLMDDANKKLGE